MNPLALAIIHGTVGFAIGAGTNDLAIKWIFHAIFAKKKREIAESVRDVISTELMTPDKVADQLATDESMDALKTMFEKHVADVCARDLPSLDILPGPFRQYAVTIGQELRRVVANRFTLECRDFARENMAELIRRTRIWDVVYESVMKLDDKEMEKLTRRVANRELRGVTLLGGVIGFAVGFIESVLICLLA
jgi:uncharacterized membrane protein YheB (UPF0754 family)